MDMVVLAQRAKFLLNQNSSVLLTGVGVVGTVGTAILTGRASFKAAALIEHKTRVLNFPADQDEVRMTKKEKVKLVWKEYIPAAGSGAITVSAIIVAHRMDAKKIVALTLASGISERALKEYKEKVVERLGVREDGKMRDEIAQDRVTKNPPRTSELVLAGDGQILCLDQLTGRYFMSTVEDLKRAENKINRELIQHMSASLSDFFDEIGLAPTTYSDEVGWNTNNLVELRLSSTLSVDNRPCLAVEYDPHPFPGYGAF